MQDPSSATGARVWHLMCPVSVEGLLLMGPSAKSLFMSDEAVRRQEAFKGTVSDAREASKSMSSLFSWLYQ